MNKELTKPTKNKYFVSERNKKILDLWNSGEHTLETIASKFGVIRERIRQILQKLRKQKFEVMSTQDVSKKRSSHMLKSKLEEANVDKISKLYLNGYSQNEILLEVGDQPMPLNTIIKELKKEGLISYKLGLFGRIKRKREERLKDRKIQYRRKVILEMRKQDKSLKEIAQALEISKIRVSQEIASMKSEGIYVPKTEAHIDINHLSRVELKMKNEKNLSTIVDSIEFYLDQEKKPQEISRILSIQSHKVYDLIYEHLVEK